MVQGLAIGGDVGHSLHGCVFNSPACCRKAGLVLGLRLGGGILVGEFALDDLLQGDVAETGAKISLNQRAMTLVQLADAAGDDVHKYLRAGNFFGCFFKKMAGHDRLCGFCVKKWTKTLWRGFQIVKRSFAASGKREGLSACGKLDRMG
jgi:hypothetical protein